MYSFYNYDVYERHNYLMNFRQNLRLFLGIYFCMDFMMGMVRENTVSSCFGISWSRATNKIDDATTQRGCQSK